MSSTPHQEDCNALRYIPSLVELTSKSIVYSCMQEKQEIPKFRQGIRSINEYIPPFAIEVLRNECMKVSDASIGNLTISLTGVWDDPIIIYNIINGKRKYFTSDSLRASHILIDAVLDVIYLRTRTDEGMTLVSMNHDFEPLGLNLTFPDTLHFIDECAGCVKVKHNGVYTYYKYDGLQTIAEQSSAENRKFSAGFLDFLEWRNINGDITYPDISGFKVTKDLLAFRSHDKYYFFTRKGIRSMDRIIAEQSIATAPVLDNAERFHGLFAMTSTDARIFDPETGDTLLRNHSVQGPNARIIKNILNLPYSTATECIPPYIYSVKDNTLEIYSSTMRQLVGVVSDIKDGWKVHDISSDRILIRRSETEPYAQYHPSGSKVKHFTGSLGFREYTNQKLSLDRYLELLE